MSLGIGILNIFIPVKSTVPKSLTESPYQKGTQEMVDPLSFSVAISALVASAPHWLSVLENTALSKGKDFLQEQAKQRFHDYLDEKERQRQMEQALKHAVERGLKNFHTDEERDQYRSILQILSETDSEALRLEAMSQLTFSDHPDFTLLTEKYNLRQRIRALALHNIHREVDATPYLKSFFVALLAELFNKPLFHEQVSNVMQIRAAQANIKLGSTTEDILQVAIEGQRTIKDILDVLGQIRGTLAENYTEEQFKRDVEVYTTHVERTLHYLKLGGIVPQEGNKNLDPEINGIFVPLRTAVLDQSLHLEEKQGSLVALLERFPYLVLLGGPGSGKSTSTRHLAWSHALANQANASLPSIRLLPGHPLPLRIELRSLTEVRRLHPHYNFLSYATKVLLPREGVEISPQMFRELLERRLMLLLFDGLDEVATKIERGEIIKDIEGFALQYPGNRILVTSRPVGYEFEPFSNRWFALALMLEFDDEQIHLFLERWYTHMLHLSPIPSNDQQELETLFQTLQENPRLHKLAENPLLLTVITALHRSERLPDRRILIYNRCADLLLEIWAKLKGTDARWQRMKMNKEAQRACVAYLGFVLHKRSQEREGDNNYSKEDIGSDVSKEFLRRKIEDFLILEYLMDEKLERQTEAKQFLDLIQQEAGLIVERGTDEDGEALYGFVHRTFQEYFAAVHIYEQYLQGDASIINEFLEENLHDPHWREVILLLLGKLKHKFVTVQLRQILEGKIKSRRSKYTDILQQDLFFVCECLIEDTKVERNFAEQVIFQLGRLVNESAFQSQQEEVWSYLKALMQTREYVGVASRELIHLTSGGPQLSPLKRLEALKIIYLYSPADSIERQQVTKLLSSLVQPPALSFEQLLEATQILWEGEMSSWSGGSDQGRHFVISAFLALGQRTDLSIEQNLQVIQAVYQGFGRQKYRNSDTLPLPLLTSTNSFSLPIEQKLQADQMLVTLSQRTDLSVEQTLQTAEVLYQYSLVGSQEESDAMYMFQVLIQSPCLSAEQKLRAARTLRHNSPSWSEEENFADQEMELAIQDLLALIKHPDLPIEQVLHTVQVLYPSSHEGSLSNEAVESIKQTLLTLIDRADLSVEEYLQVAKDQFEHGYLYFHSIEDNIEQTLIALINRVDLSIEERLQVIQVLSGHHLFEQEKKAFIQALSALIQQSDVSFLQAAQILYVPIFSEEEQEDIVKIFNQRFALSQEQAFQVALTLLNSSRHRFDYRFGYRNEYTHIENTAINTILDYIQHTALTTEQTFQALQTLWEFSGSMGGGIIFTLFWKIAHDKELPVSRRVFAINIVRNAARQNIMEEDIEDKAKLLLREIAQDENLPLRERVLVAMCMIAESVNVYLPYDDAFKYFDDAYSYTDEEGEQFLTDYLLWMQQINSIEKTSPDLLFPINIDYYAKLAKKEKLSAEFREGIYQSLRNSISEFDKIPAFPG